MAAEQQVVPAPKRKTWLWILVAVLAAGVICVVALAGFGMYFVSKHVQAKPVSSSEAYRAFDEALAQFKGKTPLYEVDRDEELRATRRVEDLPTSTTRPQNMFVLAWNPEKERLAKVSLPFWMLRLGRNKIDLKSGFDLERLQLDVDQLERVGPILLFDFRPSSGQRVLVWTQ